MNKFFAFLKQKIVQVKDENKQELQALVNSFAETECYSKQKILLLLQKMKQNYLMWNIMIANEASTGLYYSQIHNRNVALRKIKSNKEISNNIERNKILIQQMNKTHLQLKEINDLSSKWVKNMSDSIDTLWQENKNCKKEKILSQFVENQNNQKSTKQQQVLIKQTQQINDNYKEI